MKETVLKRMTKVPKTPWLTRLRGGLATAGKGKTGVTLNMLSTIPTFIAGDASITRMLILHRKRQPEWD